MATTIRQAAATHDFYKTIGIPEEIESAALVAKDTVCGGTTLQAGCPGGLFKKFKQQT